MTNVLCTFPGRHGDLLWALPTVRAIAERYDQPVDFATSAKYGRIAELVRQQEYIGGVHVLKEWQVQETAPMTPLEPPHVPEGYEKVIHLAYPGWPEFPLPYFIEKIGSLQMARPLTIELGRPWIDVDKLDLGRTRIGIGFSDEHFELKFGLAMLLSNEMHEFTEQPESTHDYAIWPSAYPGGRWEKEGFCRACEWVEAAQVYSSCKVVLACCSALHVLACAVGTPVVMMEPNEQRWNPIFYPYGKDGPQVTLVHGGDGKPTFDARHVKAAIDAHLR